MASRLTARLRSALAACLLGALVCAASCGRNTEPPPSVIVSDLKGTVEARADATTAWGGASKGDLLGAEGGVRTGAGASAWLDLAGGGVARVSESSEISVAALTRRSGDAGGSGTLESGLRLLRGLGFFEWHRDSGELTIETAHAHAAVLGTVFAVEAGERQTRVLVQEGAVQVARGTDEKTVGASQEVIVPAEGPIGPVTPVNMLGGGLPGELEAFAGEIKQERRRRDIRR